MIDRKTLRRSAVLLVVGFIFYVVVGRLHPDGPANAPSRDGCCDVGVGTTEQMLMVPKGRWRALERRFRTERMRCQRPVGVSALVATGVWSSPPKPQQMSGHDQWTEPR
jgi:hypothetical protein